MISIKVRINYYNVLTTRINVSICPDSVCQTPHELLIYSDHVYTIPDNVYTIPDHVCTIPESVCIIPDNVRTIRIIERQIIIIR